MNNSKKLKTHIVTLSDTHNRHYDIKVPNGDIIIHAGDFSGRGHLPEIEDFLNWYGNLPHTHKILIAGNHDIGTDPDKNYGSFGTRQRFLQLCKEKNITYLEDSGCEIQDNNGDIIKIWGSPIQPTFGYGWAWNRDRGEKIKVHWDKIPDDTDILITHGPPYGYGDIVNYPKGIRAGCEELLKAVERVKPKYHIFGHIHESRGITTNMVTVFVNTSALDLSYKPYNGLDIQGKVHKFEI